MTAPNEPNRDRWLGVALIATAVVLASVWLIDGSDESIHSVSSFWCCIAPAGIGFLFVAGVRIAARSERPRGPDDR